MQLLKGNKAELFWNSGKIPPQLLAAVSGVKEYKASTSDGSKTCKITFSTINVKNYENYLFL